MIEIAPILTLSDSELEAWISESGIAATVVGRCPAPCSWCSPPTDQALAAVA
jgi:hypothetical protein